MQVESMVSPGDGATFAQAGDVVETWYRGTLVANGAEFDRRVRGDARGPLSFSVGRGDVIQGWEVLVPRLSLGAQGVLLIPAANAYAERGYLKEPPEGAPAEGGISSEGVVYAIPPDADLRFEVEVVGIRRHARNMTLEERAKEEADQLQRWMEKAAQDKAAKDEAAALKKKERQQKQQAKTKAKSKPKPKPKPKKKKKGKNK